MGKCCCPPEAPSSSWFTCGYKREMLVSFGGVAIIAVAAAYQYKPQLLKSAAATFAGGYFVYDSLKWNNFFQKTEDETQGKIAEVNYEPFVFNLPRAGDLKAIKIPSAQIMIGDSNNNMLSADELGSKIWAKNGLNYMQANEGKDDFYFSLCSTKIIDNKVSVIHNFNSSQDKLNFFCTKYQIKLADISIKHVTFYQEEYTCVEVMGLEDTSAICINGYIDIKPEDINITTLGEVKIDLMLE